MFPLAINPHTRIMKGPEGVQDLHIQDVHDPDIGNWQVSAWEPTPLELERIKEGKPILLYIAGVQHPIVSLMVTP